jgi:glutaredoxin
MLTVTLYTRPGCHLCEQAHEILRTAARGLDVDLRMVNIDEDPEMMQRYGERVPVADINGDDVLEWPFTLGQAQRSLRDQDKR